MGDFIIDSLFDGGINRSCTLVKAIFSENDAVKELRYQLSFDGNIVSSNHYECTLVIKDSAPYVAFVNYNDNAGAYLTLKMAEYSYRVYQWFSKNGDKENNR